MSVTLKLIQKRVLTMWASKITRVAAMIAISLASGASAQDGTICWSWTVSDTGNGDGLIEPGEAAVLTLVGELNPQLIGFEGAGPYNIQGDNAWAAGTLELYENILVNGATDNGSLAGGNSISEITTFQFPPFINPDFDSSNPIALYSIRWRPNTYAGQTVSISNGAPDAFIYTEDSGKDVLYTGECGEITFQVGDAPPRTPDLVRNVTPADWFADPVQWVRDMGPFDTVAPGNGVDYLVDESNDPLFDIIVNFRGCVGPANMLLLQTISPNAVVQLVGRYVSFVALSGVSKAEARTMGAHPDIAFVERQLIYQTLLDVSVQTIKVRASAEYPTDNVENAFPGLNGAGVNIAIIDTGVDNHLHNAFAATPFIRGYDAFSRTFTDPVDTTGHGTHVASIALGQAWPGGGPGVAPGAGLIDVKALGPSGGTFSGVTHGIQIVYDKRDEWNIGVMSMSFGVNAASDGKGAMAQLVDLADSMGICAVVGAGNWGPNNSGLGPPATSTRAITVANSDDQNTISRSDDNIWVRSSRGPRGGQGNITPQIDELKPEVAAPGTNIRAAWQGSPNSVAELSGTSQSAPHVAGLIALMKQHRPDLDCATIKCSIIASATQLAGHAPWNTNVDPVWNNFSGWGIVDGYAAVATAAGPNVGFPSPANPVWLSPDLSSVPIVPNVGFPTTFTASINNPGLTSVSGVRVEFGIHDYSASIPTFFAIGTKIVTLNPGLNQVSLDWTPLSAGHQCLKVTIGSCTDPDLSNNVASRNLTIAMSPVQFQVRNTLSTDIETIHFVIEADDPGWTVDLEPNVVVLGGNDCPVDVIALPRAPFGTPDGTTTTVHIGAYIGDVLLGGVSIIDTMTDCNSNGIDDFLDIRDQTSEDTNGNGIPDECECTADLNGDGVLNFYDISVFIAAFTAMDPLADLNHDGVFDVFDIDAYIIDFRAGCL